MPSQHRLGHPSLRGDLLLRLGIGHLLLWLSAAEIIRPWVRLLPAFQIRPQNLGGQHAGVNGKSFQQSLASVGKDAFPRLLHHLFGGFLTTKSLYQTLNRLIIGLTVRLGMLPVFKTG